MAWYDPAWLWRKPLTVDHTKVTADQTNFPVAVILASDADLSALAQASGNDILFTSSDGTTKLAHEIELYVTATGQLACWVKIPTLSSSVDTVIYMYFANAAASNQQNATAVWDANFVMVNHLADSTPNNIAKISAIDVSTNFGAGQLQGVASDGTNLYVTGAGGGTGGHIGKYTEAGTLVSARNLDNVTDHMANAEACWCDGGFVYVSDGSLAPGYTFAQENSTAFPKVVRYAASDLSYDSVVLNETGTTGYYTEGICKYNGFWWLTFDNSMKVRRYDTSWVFQKEYNLASLVPSGDPYGSTGISFWTEAGTTYCIQSMACSNPKGQIGPNGAANREGQVGYFVWVYDPVGDTFTFHSIRGATAFDKPQGICTESGGVDGSTAWISDRWNAQIVKASFKEADLATGASQSCLESTSNGFIGCKADNTKPTQIAGQIGQAQNFNGTDTEMSVGDFAALRLSTGMTFEAWIKPSNNTSKNEFLSKQLSDDSIRSWGIYLWTDSKFYFDLFQGGINKEIGSPLTYAANAWYHVAGTYDGTTQLLYVNGVQVASAARSGAIDNGAGCDVYIGGRAPATFGLDDRYFHGIIDEARISNSARSATWLSTGYANQNSPSTFFTVGSKQANGSGGAHFFALLGVGM